FHITIKSSGCGGGLSRICNNSATGLKHSSDKFRAAGKNQTNIMKIRYTTLPTATAALLSTMALPISGHAQSADALIDKLVEKGILSVREANDLRHEADKDFTKAYSLKTGMPEWVNSLKFSGDFRGRFEQNNAEND